MLSFLVLALLIPGAHSRVYDFEGDGGAVAEMFSEDVAWKNGGIANETLQKLQPGDTLVFGNKTFYLMGGIIARNLFNVTIRFDGSLVYSDDIDKWPKKDDGSGNVNQCMYFQNLTDVTFTSGSDRGRIDGKGAKWWGFPGIGYLIRGENRPKLLEIDHGSNILVEKLYLKDSPYWTFWGHSVDGLEIRYSEIDVRRTKEDSHSIIDMTAFNTDGFDVTGKNIYIHDVKVWNQDDSICIKDNTENVLVENVEASGVGLTIGSICSSVVRNVTFRNCHMHNTYKGIYMKFRGAVDTNKAGIVEDITYENITIDGVEQFGIWIGPAQQSDDKKNPCAAHPCSLCWPTVPFMQCNFPANQTYRNVLLKNVTVHNSKKSPGLIMGGKDYPIENLVFDSVRVINSGSYPFGKDKYHCENVSPGIAKGRTWPVPECFKDETEKTEREEVEVCHTEYL